MNRSAKDLTAVSLSRLGLIAISMVSAVLLTRLTSDRELGLWFATVAFGMIAIGVLQLGVTPAIVREIGAMTHDPRPAIFSAARMIGLAFGLFAAGAITASHLTTGWALLERPALLVIYVGVLLMQRLLGEVARGLHDVIGATLLGGIVNRGLFVVFLSYAALTGRDLDYDSLILTSSALTAICTVALAPRVVRHAGRRSNSLPVGERLSLRKTWKLWMNSSLTIFLAQGDVLLVSILLGATEAGIYGLAWRIGVMASVPLQVINATAPHRFSYLFNRGATADISRLASSLATTATYTSGLMVVLLAMATPTVIPFVFDVDASVIAAPMLVLAIGQLVNSATGPAGLVLVASRHDGAVLLSSTLAIVVLVAGIAVLGSTYGLVGAAVASALSVAISNGGRVLAVRRFLGIRIDGFHVWNSNSIRSGLQLGQAPRRNSARS